MPESKKLEWKSILTKDTKEEIISFLNSHSGIIEIGVDNTGKILGVPEKLKNEYELTIGNWIRDDIYPDSKNLIDFEYNNHNILIIKISEGKNKPYYIYRKGPTTEGVYIRIGSSKRRATHEEINELFRKSSDGSFESDTSNNQKLHFTQFNSLYEKNNFKAKLKTLGFFNNEN
ncbi:MAG: ATP-binding protein [Acholeplasmatales bacterium]|jgi:ATP-dependent DNA helicase RecG|nr:ATP-binding protein [Acholeplasmatales bacterium]